ncbi:MAG: hypothetical protein IT286_03705 [Proteobacteria bacterium]|jgi:hypothetical protein|nr:hypothetical protein [Pseudomonadota bacterium]
MTWVKASILTFVTIFLSSCFDYDHEVTIKRLVGTAIHFHNEAVETPSVIDIHLFTSMRSYKLDTYQESLSEIEKEFLKNKTVFSPLSSAANEFNIGYENHERFKTSYNFFLNAIAHIEDVLRRNPQFSFEEVSYIYYIYGGALESAKLCYTTYESFRFHLPFVSSDEKKQIEAKLSLVRSKIKNSGNKLGEYIQLAESSN